MTDIESLYDKSKAIKINIEDAVLKASILDNAITSDLTKKLLASLEFIQRGYPVSARDFIVGQLFINGGSMGEPLFIQMGDTTIEITAKITTEPTEEKKNKKWYQF